MREEKKEDRMGGQDGRTGWKNRMEEKRAREDGQKRGKAGRRGGAKERANVGRVKESRK